MKKNYYYKITSSKKRSMGGYSEIASVYAIKLGKIVLLGEVKWSTSSFKGEESVVYEFLKDKKLVTAKEYKENRGYYYSSKSKVSIKSL